MKTKFICLTALFMALVISVNLAAQDTLASLEFLDFKSNLHINQHHFFYQLAKMKDPASHLESYDLRSLTSEERKLFDETIAFYKENYSERSLVFDGTLGSIKYHLAEFESSQKLSGDRLLDGIGAVNSRLIELLIATCPAYERIFWPVHDAANRKIFENNARLITALEVSALKTIEKLAQKQLPSSRMVVQLSYFTNWAGAYTTNDPYTMLMVESRETDGPGDFAELIFHEATHSVIHARSGAIGEGILKIAEKHNLKAPRQLWHAIHFYLSGQTVKDLLVEQGIADYELYMIRNGVFDAYHTAIFKHMKPYYDGSADLDTCLLALLKELNETLDR